MLKKDKREFEIKMLITNFLRAHKEHYSDDEIAFLIKNSNWGKRTSFVTDLLRQIYDELDLLQPEKNIYHGFIDILYDKFEIKDNEHILEVGGGRLPRLAHKLSLKQKNGLVTVYDPSLIIPQETKPNMILKKEHFTNNTDVSGIDKIVGFMPCESTEVLIKQACQNNVDFCVALCDGHDINTYDDLDDGEMDWQAGIVYEASKYIRDNNMGVLEQATLTAYDDPYPVLYNKRLTK